MRECKQVTDISDAVYYIPGKTGYAFRNDQIDAAIPAVVYHTLEGVTVL